MRIHKSSILLISTFILYQTPAKGQDTINEVKKIELYKNNGKSVLRDSGEGLNIVLYDSINETDSTKTKVSYSARILNKDENYLYIKPFSVDSSINQFHNRYWTTYSAHNSNGFQEVKSIRLSKIKYVSEETNSTYVFGTMAGIGIAHALIIAPLLSLRNKNSKLTFNGDFYMRQMVISLPVAAIGISGSALFNQRTYKVKPDN